MYSLDSSSRGPVQRRTQMCRRGHTQPLVLVNRGSPTPVMVMGMTRVDEVAYITVGVGELRITNTSDGNGGLIIEWFGVRDFQPCSAF